MIITRAPLRVSLFGGTSDYPNWVSKHGGLVVGGAVNLYSYCTVRESPPPFGHKYRVVTRQAEEVDGGDEITNPAVRGVLKYLAWDRSLEVMHYADMPGSSGMGTSSAFVVALVQALEALRGNFKTPEELRYAATRVEQEVLGETVGLQDQTWSSYGGLNYIQFHRSGQVSVTPLPLSAKDIADFESHLHLFFVGGRAETASAVASSFANDLSSREALVWPIVRNAEEGVYAIGARDWHRVGRLLDDSWNAKMKLSDKVSTGRVNDLYVRGRVAGAWGGKLLGAGGGGCLLFCGPPQCRASLHDVFNGEATHVPFRFDFGGARVIHSERH